MNTFKYWLGILVSFLVLPVILSLYIQKNNSKIYEYVFNRYITKGVDRISFIDRLILWLVTTRTDAHYPLPVKWLDEIYAGIEAQSVVYKESTLKSVKGDRFYGFIKSKSFPGEIIVSSSIDEIDEIDGADEITTVPVHVALVSLVASQFALRDETFSMKAEIIESASEAIAIMLDELAYNGDGQGKLQGIASLLVGTENEEMIYSNDDLVKTVHKLGEFKGYKISSQSKWMMNSNTGILLARLMPDDVMPTPEDDGNILSVPTHLMGIPIIYNEYVNDESPGETFIVIGDFKKYIIGIHHEPLTLRRFDDSGHAELDRCLFLSRIQLGGTALEHDAFRLITHGVMPTIEPVEEIDGKEPAS